VPVQQVGETIHCTLLDRVLRALGRATVFANQWVLLCAPIPRWKRDIRDIRDIVRAHGSEAVAALDMLVLPGSPLFIRYTATMPVVSGLLAFPIRYIGLVCSGLKRLTCARFIGFVAV
jgi:hypothetical protein